MLSKIIQFGLLAILVYTPLVHGTKTIGALTATYILSLTLAMLWFLKMSRANEFRFVRTSLDLPVLIFVLIGLLSTLTSVNHTRSLQELYKLINFGLLYFLIVNNLGGRGLIHQTRGSDKSDPYGARLVKVVLLAASVVAGYGLWQYFSKWPNFGEVASTMGPNANSLAGYLLLAIPLAAAVALFDPDKRGHLFGSAALIILYVCFLATHSRGGYLAFIGSTILFVILIKTFTPRAEVLRVKGRLLSLMGILLGISIMLLAVHIVYRPTLLSPTTRITRIATTEDAEKNTREHRELKGELINTALEQQDQPRFFTWQRTPANKFIIDRLHIWQRTLEMIWDHPFLGTGMGTYGIIFRGHKIPMPLTDRTISRYSIVARFTHNEYLQIGAEMGIFGLICFLWIIAIIFREGLKILKGIGDRGQGTGKSLNPEPSTLNPRCYLTIGLLCGLTGVLLHSLIDFPLRPGATGILAVFFAALIMPQRKETKYVNPVRPVTPVTPVTDKTDSAGKTGSTGKTSLLSPPSRTCIIIGIALIGVAQVSTSYLAHWRYKRGEGFVREKIYDRAVIEYQQAIKLSPRDDALHFALGNLYREIASRLPEEEKFWLAQAIAEYEQMVSLSPLNARYKRNLAVLYWLASEQKDKLLIFDPVLAGSNLASPSTEFIPREVEGLRINSASVLNEAIRQFKESIRIEPTYTFAYTGLGVLYAKIGWLDRAASQFIKAIELEPNYVEARYDLALVYSQKGLFDEAIEQYQEIITIKNKGLFGEITCGYEDKLINFDYSLAHFQLASLYEKQGQPESARAQYEEVLKLRPDNPQAKEALARLK